MLYVFFVYRFRDGFNYGKYHGNLYPTYSHPTSVSITPFTYTHFQVEESEIQSISPEPFASMIDVITAGQFMESAIHKIGRAHV